MILATYKMYGYTKGAKGIYMAMIHMDPPVIMNLKKIRLLMDKFNLSCPIRKANPYRRMAKELQTSNAADNLLKREFECYGSRTVLLTDITYLLYNGTFAYPWIAYLQRKELVFLSFLHGIGWDRFAPEQ